MQQSSIQVHFKGHNTVQTLHMAPKDKDNMCQKSGVIYHYKCSHTDCPEQYKGEYGRTFGDRYREHFRVPSPFHLHSKTTEHQVDLECFTIIYREAQGLPEQSRKPCTSEWMILPLTGNWANTTCLTCGMKCCGTPLHCNSSNKPATPLLLTMGTSHHAYPIPIWGHNIHNFNLPLKNPTRMVHYPSWTLGHHSPLLPLMRGAFPSLLSTHYTPNTPNPKLHP